MTTPATTTTAVAAAYDQWSVQYDHDRNPTRDLDALVLPRVLGGLRPRATLETGCGTGKNTAFLAGISQSVLAVDFSAGMLAKAAAVLACVCNGSTSGGTRTKRPRRRG